MGLFEGFLALLKRGHLDGFDGLDAEGFDDCFHAGSVGLHAWFHRFARQENSPDGPGCGVMNRCEG